MPKVKHSEYSATPASNTDVDGINIDENCPASNINNAIRSVMSHIKELDNGTNAITSPVATGLTVTNNIVVGGTVDGRDVATDGSKLDGIESGATADQSAAEIRTLVESASDSNVFTDADHTKLNGIETGATADQSASEILTAIKTVDGAGSGLDADTLDGSHASAFLTGNQTVTLSGDVTGSGSTSISTNIAANVVGASELNVSGNGSTSQFLRSDGDGSFSWATPTDTNTDTTYSAGTGLNLSGTTFSADISGTTQTVAANSVTATAGRTYAVQAVSGGDLVVNVPWSDTNTDTNTTYSAGTALTLSGTTFSVTNNGIGATQLNVSGNGSTSQFLRSDGDGTFSWATPTDTNTTYSAGTALSLSGTTFSVTSNGIGATQLNVSGNGTSGQFLRSDGDGSFTWAEAGGGGEAAVEAWANFYGGDNTLSINDSGGVSSITDNTTGTHTVNFSTAFSNTNYVVAGSCRDPNDNNTMNMTFGLGRSDSTKSTSACQIITAQQDGQLMDSPEVNALFFYG